MRQKRRVWHASLPLDNTNAWLVIFLRRSVLSLSAVFASGGRRCGWRGEQRSDFGFEIGFPSLVAVDADVFAADSGNGLQQELGDIAEGDGLFLGDAALRHQEENLGQGAVDVGGGGEVAAKSYEGGAYEAFVWKTVAATFLFFSQGVVSAKLCVLIAALASVGKMEFAARRDAGIG